MKPTPAGTTIWAGLMSCVRPRLECRGAPCSSRGRSGRGTPPGPRRRAWRCSRHWWRSSRCPQLRPSPQSRRAPPWLGCLLDHDLGRDLLDLLGGQRGGLAGARGTERPQHEGEARRRARGPGTSGGWNASVMTPSRWLGRVPARGRVVSLSVRGPVGMGATPPKSPLNFGLALPRPRPRQGSGRYSPMSGVGPARQPESCWQDRGSASVRPRWSHDGHAGPPDD